MLSIRAMAEMGPWVLTFIDVLNRTGDEHCQRCSEPIRYVWVMAKQIEPKEVQRIGSTCGPWLELISQEMWDTTTKPFKMSLRHLLVLEKLVEWERDFPNDRPADYELGWADRQRSIIAAGGLDTRGRRIMGYNINLRKGDYERSLRRRYPGRV